MTDTQPKLVIRYRSAISGKYVSKEYALHNPATTVREVEERRQYNEVSPSSVAREGNEPC